MARKGIGKHVRLTRSWKRKLWFHFSQVSLDDRKVDQKKEFKGCRVMQGRNERQAEVSCDFTWRKCESENLRQVMASLTTNRLHIVPVLPVPVLYCILVQNYSWTGLAGHRGGGEQMRLASFFLVLLAAVQVMMASSKEVCNEPANCSSAFDDCTDTAAEEPNEVCKCYGALKVCIGMCYGWAAHQAACPDACYMSQSTCSTGRWVQPMGEGSGTSPASRLSGEWLFLSLVDWFCTYM